VGYTGNAAALQIGDNSGIVTWVKLKNIFVSTFAAGNSAVGIAVTQGQHIDIEQVFVDGKGAPNTQTGIQFNGTSGFNGYSSITYPTIVMGGGGTQLGFTGAAATNNITGIGGFYDCGGGGVGTGIDIGGTQSSGNSFYGVNISNCITGIKYENTAEHNFSRAAVFEDNTTDVAFAAGSASNLVEGMDGPNGGTLTFADAGTKNQLWSTTGLTSGDLPIAENTAPAGAAGFTIFSADPRTHRAMMNNNNGGAVQIVAAGADINTSDQVTATHLASPLPAAQGGTANGFFTIAGPATSAKTYTFQNASANVPSLVGASTTNALPKFGDTTGTVLGNSSVTDNGTTVSTTENIATTGTTLQANNLAGQLELSTDNFFTRSAAGNVAFGSTGGATNGQLQLGSISIGGQGVVINSSAAVFGIGGLNGGPSSQFAVNTSGLPTKSNNITLAGQGLVPIPCITSQKSETAADTNVLTCAIAGAVGSYRVSFVMSVSAANAATLGWTATWTDSNGNAQAPTNLPLFQIGTAAPALTFTTSAAGDYYGDTQVDVNTAGTSIVIELTFSGTSFTANVSAWVERII
jgi:hypothetical protein